MQCLTIKKPSTDSEINDKIYYQIGLDRCEFFDLEVTDLEDRWEIVGEMSSLQCWKLDIKDNDKEILQSVFNQFNDFIITLGREAGEA